MKRIINGKKYDTETAERLAQWNNGQRGSFDVCEETLYRKRNGEFFLHGRGGARSPYSGFCEDGLVVGGESIALLSDAEARRWGEIHLSGDEYEDIFGVVEDDDSQATITLSVSSDAMDRGLKTAAKLRMSLPALVEALLQNI